MTSEKRHRRARRAATALCLFTLFACIALKAEGQGTAAPKTVMRLSLPGRDWALDLSLPHSDKVMNSLNAEGRERLVMAVPAAPKKMQGWTIRMRPAQSDGDGTAFRAYTLAAAKKNGLQTSGWKSFEYGGLPLLKHKFDFIVPTAVPGEPLLMSRLRGSVHFLTAYLARDGVWIEITLSGESVGEKEEKVFYAVLDTVKLVDMSNPTTSFDFFHKGRPLYEVGEHRKAAEYYRRALELERRERSLDAVTWRKLVEEAAGAHGTVGDLDEAHRAVAYGLSQEPDNAIFHYLMAAIHASRDDLDATVASLQQAFQHKATLPAGQRLPDPRKHPPFQRFSKLEKFRQATKNMKP